MARFYKPWPAGAIEAGRKGKAAEAESMLAGVDDSRPGARETAASKLPGGHGLPLLHPESLIRFSFSVGDRVRRAGQ
jgi:hypothetical protein